MNIPLIISIVITSCCLNVVFLEAIIKKSAGSGNLITFSQFLFISIEGFIFTSNFCQKKPTIPIKKYLTLVIFFFLVNVSNNYALNFNISVPLHIIFRSGSLMANMMLGILILKRQYSLIKYLSVGLITIGIIAATLASSQSKPVEAKTVGQTNESTVLKQKEHSVYDYTIGISLLSFALIMSARLGIFQEVLFTTYGKHPKEAVFYQHALSLPGFILMLPDIYNQVLAFNNSEPSLFSIPCLWVYLSINMITQYSCIMSVMILMSECTSLTVTLVLTIRKFISLVFSIFYFQNPFTLAHWLATLLVFTGSLLFMDLPVVNNRFYSIKKYFSKTFRYKKHENVITIKPLLQESDKNSESE